jgi:pimeloyl-ACP methyl ester carboxylesterase
MRTNSTANLASIVAFVVPLLVLTCGGAPPRTFAAETAAPEGKLPVVEKDATVFTFKLHYREAGAGPAVILLHGLGGDGSRWESLMQTLAPNFRVIALDQIGFGQSDKPLANYNHALLAEFLAEFAKTIGAPQASLVGHSMGGYVAIYAAVHHPDLVDRLVLVDGGGLEYAPRSDHLIQIQNGSTLAETREYFELMFYDKSRITDALVRDNYARRLNVAFTIGKMQEARVKGLGRVNEAEARGIRAPTLILWGKHDKLLDPSDAELLNRLIPNSRVHLFDAAGHIPQIEQRDQFNQQVRDFLTANQ